MEKGRQLSPEGNNQANQGNTNILAINSFHQSSAATSGPNLILPIKPSLSLPLNIPSSFAIPSVTPLNNPTNCDKVKSGRKKKQQTSRYLQTPMNPYYKTYEHLMKYLDSIGLIHGLCFTSQLRKSLKQFNKYQDIDWKDTSEGWYYHEERNYLKSDAIFMKRLRRIMMAIRARSRKNLKNGYKDILKQAQNQKDNRITKLQYNYCENETQLANDSKLHKWTLNKLIDFVIRPGEMVDSQCRHQLYNLNISILECIFSKKYKHRNMSREHATMFFQYSKFFSRKFTTFKKKNWIQFKRCSEQNIAEMFVKMFTFFKIHYQDILQNFDEWDHYNTDMKTLFDEAKFDDTNKGCLKEQIIQPNSQNQCKQFAQKEEK